MLLFAIRCVSAQYNALRMPDMISDTQGFIIVFTTNHCPFAKPYTGRLNDLI